MTTFACVLGAATVASACADDAPSVSTGDDQEVRSDPSDTDIIAGADDDVGPLAVKSTSARVEVEHGISVAADLYVPEKAGLFPLVVLRHGYLREKRHLAGWGRHLGSHGFVVVVPNARARWQDHAETDGRDILTVVDWAVRSSGEPTSVLAGKVDASRRAVGGHSSGGLAALVAASHDSTLKALVLLDTEGGKVGEAAAPKATVPALGIFGAPHFCNEHGGGIPSFEALAGPRFGLRIVGASHCDGEYPSSIACAASCGRSNADRQREYRRFTTAFLKAYVTCDPASFPFVDETTRSNARVDVFTAFNRSSPAGACAR